MSPFALFLCLALALGASLVALLSPGGVIPAAWGLAALLAWSLEGGAVQLPGMGYFSCAGSLYLALAMAGAPGARVALMAGFLGILLRCLLREALSKRQLGGFLCDFLPLACACAAARFSPHPAVVLDVYLALGLLAPGTMATDRTRYHGWRQVRRRTTGIWLAAVLLAPVIRSVLTSPWLLLALAPSLWGLQFAAARALAGWRVQEREDLRAHLERSWKETESERDERQRLQADLHVKMEESLWQEEVEGQFRRCQSLDDWSDRLFRLTRAVVPFRSTAILEEGEGGVFRVLYERSPESLAAHLLVGPREDLRVHAFSALPAPLLAGERRALAYPLAPGILFYAGGHDWTDAQQHRVRIALDSAAGNLERVRELDALRREATQAVVLRQRVDALANVLEISRSLTAQLEPDEVVEQLAVSLKQLPHDALAIYRVEGQELGEVGRFPAEAEFGPIAAAVAETGLPLLVEEIASTRFQPPMARQRSLLAVPVPGNDGLAGVILLSAAAKGAFRREDQDWLLLVGYLSGQALGNAELHMQVVEALRRQQESETQLIQSSKMAAVGQLAAGVAHELNTPLGTVVLGLDAYLRRQDPNPLLSTALDAARQAKEIVSKLLFYSREARVGRMPTDLNRVLRDTLQLIGQQLRLDKVEVALETQPLAEVEANQNEVQQVLTNLILNARDAVLEGDRRRIEVSTAMENDWVVVRVRDFGEGIPADVRDRIFEPFFTTKPVGKGTGLGLSVSQQIVSSHSGTLELEEGEGTTFAMRLPRK